MQSQADKTSASHPPTKKKKKGTKQDDRFKAHYTNVSNVNIPKGHSKWGLGHTESLRHVSLGFGSDLLWLSWSMRASSPLSGPPVSSCKMMRGPMLPRVPAHPDIHGFPHRDREPLPSLQREAPICPKHPIQGQKGNSLCWEGHRCQFSHQRWSSAFSPLLKVRGWVIWAFHPTN